MDNINVMGHRHSLFDVDTHYVIDPITRNITNNASRKNTLIQHDHNSERFTFEIPRHVDGHDMSLCDSIQIHYINIESGTGNKQTGVYDVGGFIEAIEQEDENNLAFSWIVSGNATKYAGTLSFMISFACTHGGVTMYRWNTNINNTFTIAKGILNDESIVESYPDILAEWREELFSINYAYEAAKDHGFEGTEEEWLESLKGMSAYQIAVQEGFEGTEAEWLTTLSANRYTFEVTLYADEWLRTDDPNMSLIGGSNYAGKYHRALDGILETDILHIGLLLPTGGFDEDVFLKGDGGKVNEYRKISYASPGHGGISFLAADEVPTMDLTLFVEVIR